MKLSERVHDRYVQKRRADILRDHVAELISRDASALDVGRGDGLLAYWLREVRPRSKVARRAGRGLAAHTAIGQIDRLTEWCYGRGHEEVQQVSLFLTVGRTADLLGDN